MATDRGPSPGRRSGDVRIAHLLRAVGTDIETLCRQVGSILADDVTPGEVRDRLEAVDRELARLARLTGAVDVPPPPDADDARRLAGRLTDREWECLELLVRGLDTSAMAGHLGVSSTTVRTHVQSVLAKLGVNSRLQAVALTIRTTLLPRTS
jgi:DNA-binding NarL/FixJ family response regulator